MQFRSSSEAVQEQLRSSSGIVHQQFSSIDINWNSSSGAVQNQEQFGISSGAAQEQFKSSSGAIHRLKKTLKEIAFPIAASEDRSTCLLSRSKFCIFFLCGHSLTVTFF